MAKINQVVLCTACGYELKDQGQCPRCGQGRKLDFRTTIETPDYVALQIQDQLAGIDPKRNGPKLELDTTKLTLEQRFWFRNCGDRERRAAMQDARNVLRTVLHANCSVDTIRNLVLIGKQIGELANAIDQYVQKGGGLNVSPTTGPADFDEDSATAG